MFIPKSKSTLSHYPRWLNSEIVNLLHKIKSRKKKVHQKSSSVNNVVTVKMLEDQLASKVSSSKLEYESRLVSDFSSKSNNRIYKYISSLTKQSSLPSSLHLESKTESSNFGVASIFNEYFHSVFNQSSSPPTFSSDGLFPRSDSHTDLEITLVDVFKSRSY